MRLVAKIGIIGAAVACAGAAGGWGCWETFDVGFACPFVNFDPGPYACETPVYHLNEMVTIAVQGSFTGREEKADFLPTCRVTWKDEAPGWFPQCNIIRWFTAEVDGSFATGRPCRPTPGGSGS